MFFYGYLMNLGMVSVWCGVEFLTGVVGDSFRATPSSQPLYGLRNTKSTLKDKTIKSTDNRYYKQTM